VTKAKSTSERGVRKQKVVLWRGKEECLRERHRAAYDDARSRPWPIIERLQLPSAPELDSRAELDKVSEELGKLGPRLLELLEDFRAKLAEHDEIQHREFVAVRAAAAKTGAALPPSQVVRDNKDQETLLRAIEIVGLSSAFARQHVTGTSRAQTTGRPGDPARGRAAWAVEIRASKSFREATGDTIEPWAPTPRDLALLSICEGADLPDGWEHMNVAQLIDAERRAMAAAREAARRAVLAGAASGKK
jgi:hypothetical protein